MGSKLFITASTILLISTLFTFDHLLSPSPLSRINNSLEDQLRRSEVIQIEGAVGPESFAFDPTGGGPYTGVSDGRIIKWDGDERRWIDFAVTSPEREVCGELQDHERMEHICGRPLGMRFNEETGDLYIADAYMGLLVVGPNGGLATKVTTKAHGISLQFANALDIDRSSGVVYFTDSSSLYPRRNYMSVIVSGDTTGRLIKYDPKTNETKVVLNNLSFPNGVALSQNGEFILVAETTLCRILKLWLQSPKAGLVEVFAQLSGFPDNIKRNNNGEFWVGIHSRRGKFLEWILSNNWIGKFLINNLPFALTKMEPYLSKFRACGLAVKLGEDGEILEMLEDKIGKIWRSASEVMEENGNLWVGSVTMPFVAKLNFTN
ncbi:hypothetical protein LguiB_004185 [Lonicera macranthoides]